MLVGSTCINTTCKIGKLKASLNEKVLVDRHGCHTALNFASELKETKTRFLC